MKLVRRLSNLGYGTRKDATRLLRRGRVRDEAGVTLGPRDVDPGTALTVDGEPLDPRPPLVVLLHKPTGLVTSRDEPGQPTVYSALPPRFLARTPALAPVGRLDKDTSGLLLLTDEGTLLHRLTHPRHHVPRVYEVQLARPIDNDALERLRDGSLVLRGDAGPLRPAGVDRLAPCRLRMTLHEGRYHQVRRMVAAVGSHVDALHRSRLGPLSLGALAPGAWRILAPAEVATLWEATGAGSDG